MGYFVDRSRAVRGASIPVRSEPGPWSLSGLLLPLVEVLLVGSVGIAFLTGAASGAEPSEFQFKKQPEIQQVKPQKPVKIKLHRTAKGEYTWDLSGDNVDEIVNADKKLRKLLKLE